MKKVYEFLKNAGVYYLATVEGDQPRVRPFGTYNIFEDKLYIQTGKVKPCSRQLAANPKAEICGCASAASWWRMTVWKPERPCWTPTPICGPCMMKMTATRRFCISGTQLPRSVLLAPRQKPTNSKNPLRIWRRGIRIKCDRSSIRWPDGPVPLCRCRRSDRCFPSCFRRPRTSVPDPAEFAACSGNNGL